MSRYAAIVLALGLLAGLYWGLGGFESSTPAEAPHSVRTAQAVVPQDQADSVATEDAAGGPDDGPALGLAPVGPGFAALDPETRPPGADIEGWEDVVIERRESFYVALRRVGLEHETIMDLVDTSAPHTDLEKVKRGDHFLLARDDQAFRALRFDLDREHYLVVEETEKGLAASVAQYPIEETVHAVRGVIQTNLFEALQDQGADPTVADHMAEILGWNIDFFRDLRVGDDFVVIYREYRHGDEKVRDPQVLAVHFTNRGQLHEAYRYTDEHELPAYYEPSGESLERQFLRAPLKYTRISSGFSYRRLHPILKRYRPHLGVDFVAAVGTPVMATAGGVVIRRSYDRAGGHTVGLRHGNGYESYYLHLSKYPSGLKKGDRVEQGDVIGFVGSTGWSTGAHLDYRIKKNGKWLNPKKLSLPPADPVAEERMEDFQRQVARLASLIEGLPDETTTLVLNPRELAPEIDLHSIAKP